MTISGGKERRGQEAGRPSPTDVELLIEIRDLLRAQAEHGGAQAAG